MTDGVSGRRRELDSWQMNRLVGARETHSLTHKVLAWCVHLYTALGLMVAAGMAVLIVRGGDEAFRDAFALMVVATLVDATDGTLARRVQVKTVLPGFDGRRLDDLIDFLTFTSLPLLLVWRGELLPKGWEPWLLFALLASAYGFSQAEAKTPDGYFLGFPSYWNIVAFYLYALQPMAGWLAVTLVVVPAVLTFVPSVYLYPSQRGRLNLLTKALSVPWLGLVVVVLWYLPADRDRAWWQALVSLYYPVYYLFVSWGISMMRWRDKRWSLEKAGVSEEE
jgi:phosphatidylcholine synthase